MPYPPRLMDNVLPSNATLFERSLAATGVDRMLALDTERLKNLWNPWKAHPADLPYLAWALSVDLWDSSWPDTKKRSVIANAIKHHRLKGTLAGIETYLDLIGSRLVRAITPPAKIFSGPSLTREQREEWLQRLPQIRVWRQYERSTAGLRIFSGGPRHKSFLEGRFVHPNDAINRLRRRARWVVNGVETDARVDNFESYFRVYKRTTLPYATFTKQVKAQSFYIPSTAAERVVTIEPVSLSPWRTSIGPRLTPVTSEPETVALRGLEGHATYSGRTFGKRFFVPSRAGFRLFERYAVHDGTAAAKRPSIQFMGKGRYGMPGHTAELKIEMRDKLKPWKAREGIIPPKTRFWMPHDGRLLDRNRQAVNAAKRRSDRILIDTTTRPGFIAGLPFFAGDSFIA